MVSLSWIFKNPKKLNPSFRVRDLMRIQTKLLQFCGMCQIDYRPYLPKKLYFLSKPLNLLVFVFWAFMNGHLALLFIIEFGKIRSDNATVKKITDLITMIVINTFCFSAVVYFQVYHDEYERIVNYMNQNFRFRSAYGLKFVTLEKCYLLSKRFTVIWAIMGLSGSLQWVWIPIVTGMNELPVNVSYPFDQNSSLNYGVLFVLHIFCQIVTSLGFVNSGSVMASTIFMTCGQFDILVCSLKNVQITAMSLSGYKSEKLIAMQSKAKEDIDEINPYFYSDEIPDDVHKNSMESKQKHDKRPNNLNNELKALVDCVKHHKMIMEIAKMIEEYLNVFVLFKSLQVTIQMCNLAFTISSVTTESTESFMHYYRMGIYLYLTVIDVFLICFWGEILKQQSLKVGDALFSSRWYLCSASFQRIMLFVMANSTKPLHITGGKFFILDYNKLTGILKASFSYYTLLQNLGKN